MPGAQPEYSDYLVYTPSTPLYRQCASLRVRLLLMQGFSNYFALAANGCIESSQFSDPVTQIWDVFSLGISLCYIFDLLPEELGFTKINHSKFNPLVYKFYPDREKKSAVALFAMEVSSPRFRRLFPRCKPLTAEELWDRESTNGLAKAVHAVKAITDRLPTSAFLSPPLWPEPDLSSIPTPERLQIPTAKVKVSRDSAKKNVSRRDSKEANDLENLRARISDWKGLDTKKLGYLLSSDCLTTTRAKKDRAYHTFLFKNIILFCDRVPQGHYQTTNSSATLRQDDPLRLKGRIYLSNVITVLPIQPRSFASPGTITRYPLTVWWNGNSSCEHITLKFQDQEQRDIWESHINTLSSRCLALAFRQHILIVVPVPVQFYSIADESRLREVITKTADPNPTDLTEPKRSSDPVLSYALSSVRSSKCCSLRATSWPQLVIDNTPLTGAYHTARNLLSGIIKDSDRREELATLQGGEAQCIVDFLNIALHEHGALDTDTGRYMLKLLSKLAKSACVFPQCYELKGVELESTKPQDGGGFADIYKGTYEQQSICLKVVRVFRRQDNSKLLSAHVKELTLWAHLQHENISPFYGAYYLNDSPERVCIVSPWMQNGDLSSYLERFPRNPRLPLVYDVVSGLTYLHESKIIHGDLKAKNVLVSNSGRALLADFGLSHVAMSTGLLTTRISQGTMRWTAPELLADDSEDYIPPTKESDIWSLGCLLYEAFTRKLPFHQYSNDFRILTAIVKSREIPLRPPKTDDPLDTIDDRIWHLLRRCWNYDPSSRPGCVEIGVSIFAMQELHELLTTSSGIDEQGVAFWQAMKAKSNIPVDYTQVSKILLRGSKSMLWSTTAGLGSERGDRNRLKIGS
ncbi:hypothetical protein NP233_g4676 [Leucocoprinus birnbaumii]|uniref:Protein kinase domain-containing protein n=1 Tax=Leucocoprinus birnbaumii TaxID=56174 RepID=A0AAD5YRM9_9AGAR|nr:hypothetical protein NP233_g4676 [Leucocoprinus birnbaumii]